MDENEFLHFVKSLKTFAGEMGEPVIVDGSLHEVRQAKQHYGFNTYVSDMISLNRSIPDVRMPE